MYYATEFTKFPKYKRILQESLQKPVIPFSKVKPEHVENPSVTGYAFETLFAVCQLNKNNFKHAFRIQFDRAEENLEGLARYQDYKNFFSSGKLCSPLPKIAYDEKIPVIKKLLKRKSVKTIERSVPFRYLEISTDFYLNPLLSWTIGQKTGLYLLGPRDEVKRIIILDVDSVNYYLKSITRLFLKEVITFYNTRKCTRSFAKTILFFTYISSQFSIAPLFDCLFFSEGYLKQITRQFQSFCKNHSLIKGKLTRTPSFDFQEIAARPDLLINGKLYEIKACKRFAMAEYLQALTYLIFSQHPTNIKLHGEVRSIILYYVLVNRQIEIKATDIKLTKDLWKKIEAAASRFRTKTARKYGIKLQHKII